jgi:hypothetical protein
MTAVDALSPRGVHPVAIPVAPQRARMTLSRAGLPDSFLEVQP